MSVFRHCAGAWVMLVVTQVLAGSPDMIARYEQCSRNYEHISATVEVRETIIQSFDEGDGSLPPDRLFATSTIQFWRDGANTRAISVRTQRQMLKGKLNEHRQDNEWLVTPTKYIIVPKEATSGKATDKGIIVKTRTPTDGKDRMLVAKVSLPVFGATFDYLGPGIVAQMGAAPTTTAEDTVDGRRVVRVDFTDAWGDHSLWLDPARGYHPVRLRQHKSGGHLVQPGVRLNDVGTKGVGALLTTIETNVIVTDIRETAGRWFARRFEVYTKHGTDQPDKADDRRSVFAVTDISTDPFSGGNRFDLATPVPNGSRVTFDDQGPIRYEWQNGEVLKSVDQSYAEGLAHQEFRESSWPWVWVAICLLVAGGGSAWVLRRRRLAPK